MWGVLTLNPNHHPYPKPISLQWRVVTFQGSRIAQTINYQPYAVRLCFFHMWLGLWMQSITYHEKTWSLHCVTVSFDSCSEYKWCFRNVCVSASEKIPLFFFFLSFIVLGKSAGVIGMHALAVHSTSQVLSLGTEHNGSAMPT